MKKELTMFDVFKFHVKTFREDKDSSLFLIYILHMIVSGSIPLVAVIMPRFIIDAISINDLNATVMYIFIFCGLTLFFHVSRIKLMYKAEGKFVASRVRRGKVYVKKFRNASFLHLEDSNFHKKRNEAFNTMSSNFNGYQGTITLVFNQLPEIFAIVGFIVILGIFNPWIIVVALGCAILQFLLAVKAKKFAIANHEESTERDRLAQYYYRLAHDFSYGKDIRINDLSDSMTKRYKKKTSFMLKLFKEIKIHEYKFNIVDILFLLITNGLTYYLVIQAYFDGLVTLGTISMTIMSVLMITVKLQATFKELARLKEETEKTKKYIAFFNDEYYFESSANEQYKLKDIEIEFVNVSFKYPSSDTYALKNVSFKVGPGQKLALVGVNGSGKSTIVKLLSGFYKPEEGNIYINGININDINLQNYRDHLAVVFQEVNIYAASILENITGANPTEEETERAINALKQVGLYEKVKNYENKEHQQLLKIIDESGTDLSGGEAQKLAIARAIYKENTRLIILDEPTASLDAIAEKEMYEHFNELVNNRTAIMISHRLASTKFCDDIIYLNNGEVKEHGTHEQLMNDENSKYKEMFLVQGKYYQEEEQAYEIQ